MDERAEAGGISIWGEVDDAEALERYRTLVDAVDDGIYQLDGDGRIVGANETLVERTGRAREDLLGDRLSVLLDGPVAERVDDIVRDIVTTEEPDRAETLECAVRVAGGETVVCEHRLTALPGDAGGVGGVTGVVRFPESGRREEAGRESNPVEDAGHADLSRVSSEQTDSRRVSSGQADSRRASSGQADSRRENPVRADSRQANPEREALGRGEPPDATLRTADPGSVPAGRTLASILDEADTVGVFVLDSDFRVAWIDETIERYFGVDREAVLGADKRRLVEETMADRVADGEFFTETVFATYDDNSYIEQFECRVTPGDDREERWLEHLSRPIKSGAYAGGRVELYYDVTEQHRRAYQLRRLNEAVREWLAETSREAVAERACAHLSDILELEINGVFLYDDETGELLPAALSEPGEALFEDPPTFSTDDSIAGRVYETGEAVVYDDVRSDPDVYNPETPIRSEIVLPIGVHGVVIIGSEARDAFDDGDLMLAKVVASSLESTFDRIRHERQLERERDLVDRLLETSPVGIQVLDAGGEVTRMNERLTELLAVDDVDSYDPGDRQTYDEDGAPIPVEEQPSARTLATGEPVFDEVLQVELPAGDRHWLSVSATPVLTDDGAIDRVVTTAEDVTSLKERERRLERQRDDLAAELEEIYGRITDGFVALNEDWGLTHLNERAAEILGVDEAELLGRTIWEVMPAARDTVFEDRYREAMETQEPVSFVAYHEPTDAWYEEHVYPSETGLSVYFRDVTERKEMERELRESEQRFRQIAENIEAVVWMTPPDKHEMTYVNPAYEEIWGRSRESLYEEPTTFLEAIHPEDRDRVREAVDAQADGEYDEEYRVVQPDGEVRWVRDRAFPVEDDGEIYRIVGITEDVTERKERERQLERSERRYRTLAEYFPNGVVTLFDRDLRYELAAGQGFDVISVDPEDVRGRHFSEVWDDQTVAALEPAFHAALEGEKASVELTYEGREWVVHVVPITDDRGEVFAGMTMAQDITERKRRERELERALDLLERTERIADVAGWEVDPETKEPYWSDHLFDLLDVDYDEQPSLEEALDVYHTEADRAAVEETLEEALETGEPFEVTARFPRPEGDVGWLRIQGAPEVVDGGVVSLRGAVQDVTERKERERRLEELVERLEESNDRLEQFAYAASHDLQEPLRMVSSYLRLLERRYADDLDEEAEEFLKFAVDGADRMREMIDGLLEYSRVDTQGDPLEPVDLGAILEDVREDLRLQIRETDAKITVEDLPRVEGDASQLRQVFQNLLENAIEYSGDESPRVHVSSEREGDDWIVSVADEGIGIDPDDQQRVFEVFQRLHTHGEHPGTGIGLALCERIVERHDGDIWVESAPGEGTTFSVRLPAAG